MKNLVIGLGEIGQAILEVIDGQDTQTKDIEPDYVEPGMDIMHICFPYSDTFVNDVKNYIEQYHPAHVIIYSSVPPGTTYDISPAAVHSPIEGRHPDLDESIRLMVRWIGYDDLDEAQFFARYFNDLGIKTRLVEHASYTEALKLLSTTEYGINLVFADYKARVAEEIGMDYELTKLWNKDYNRLYEKLDPSGKFRKFALDPPGGVIGGHCVIPNAKLLNEDFPDELLDIIEEFEK